MDGRQAETSKPVPKAMTEAMTGGVTRTGHAIAAATTQGGTDSIHNAGASQVGIRAFPSRIPLKVGNFRAPARRPTRRGSVHFW